MPGAGNNTKVQRPKSVLHACVCTVGLRGGLEDTAEVRQPIVLSIKSLGSCVDWGVTYTMLVGGVDGFEGARVGAGRRSQLPGLCGTWGGLSLGRSPRSRHFPRCLASGCRQERGVCWPERGPEGKQGVCGSLSPRPTPGSGTVQPAHDLV